MLHATSLLSNQQGLPARVPSSVLKLTLRRRKSIALKTFKERRCLSDPWYDEPETEAVVKGDPEKVKVTDANGVTIGVLTESHRMRAFELLIMINEGRYHTPSIAFPHLPPGSARIGSITEGPLFISVQLSTDAVSALRKVWVLITLRASLSGTFLQTLPDLVTPLKGHSLSLRSCPPTQSAPSEGFGY